MSRLASALAAGAAVVVATAAVAESGVWREGPPLERPRAALSAAAVGSNVYVAGGAGLLEPATDFDVYESMVGEWRELAPLPEGRARFGMASLDRTIYIAGGAVDGEGAVATAFSYDTSGDSWDPMPDLPGPRVGHALLATNGKLYALGGDTAAVDVYDPAAREWTRIFGEEAHARFGAAAAVLDGKLYLIGGRTDDGVSARVDIYDPAADSWSRAPDLPVARTGLAAAAVDGVLHVLGGSAADGRDAAVDHWVLEGGAWANAPEMPAPRADFAAVAAGGQLVIVGGGGGGGFYGPFTAARAVDLYEPGS